MYFTQRLALLNVWRKFPPLPSQFKRSSVDISKLWCLLSWSTMRGAPAVPCSPHLRPLPGPHSLGPTGTCPDMRNSETYLPHRAKWRSVAVRAPCSPLNIFSASPDLTPRAPRIFLLEFCWKLKMHRVCIVGSCSCVYFWDLPRV